MHHIVLEKGFPFGSGGGSLAFCLSHSSPLVQPTTYTLLVLRHLGLSDGAMGTITRHSKMLRVHRPGGVDVFRP